MRKIMSFSYRYYAAFTGIPKITNFFALLPPALLLITIIVLYRKCIEMSTILAFLCKICLPPDIVIPRSQSYESTVPWSQFH